MIISPRNSFGFNYELAAVEVPDALRVRFVDTTTWENTERLVFDDGFDENNAEKYETLEAKGVTNPQQAWKFGRYHIAQQRLRPERYSFKQDVQHLRYQRGDMLTIQYDTILVGLAAGRIKEVVSDTEIVLDEVVEDQGANYGVKIQHQDGSVSTTTCTLGSEPANNRIFLDNAVTITNPDDLVIFGEAGRESIDVKVTAIEPEGDFVAKITTVPAADEIDQAWDGDIPAFDPVLTNPVDPDAGAPSTPELDAVISNITDLAVDAEGSTVSAILVNIALAGTGGFSYKVQLRYREQGTDEWTVLDPTEKTNIRVESVKPGSTYEIQVRAVRGDKFSPWSGTKTHTVYELEDVSGTAPTIVSLSQLDKQLPPIGSVQSYIVADYTVQGVQPLPEKVEIKWGVQGESTFDTRTFEVEPETDSYSVRLPIDTYGVTYEVRARAKGVNGVWSDYSDASTINPADPQVTNQDLIDFISNDISESQLAQDLNSRIDLVDASAAVSGSVNQRIEQTASELNGDIVAVEQTTSTNASSINGLEAQYTVKIDNNGAVAGFGLASTSSNNTYGGNFSEFYVNADRFAILPQTTSTSGRVSPFIVQNNQVFIDDVLIADASIDSAKIADASVDTLKIADQAVTVPGSADGEYSASLSYNAPISMAATVIGVFTQGSGRNGEWVVLKIDDVELRREKPASGTVGALARNIEFGPGPHTFSIYAENETGEMNCNITVLGTKR